VRRVRGGHNTSFWKMRWRGGMPSSLKYPRIFMISNQEEASVTDMRVDSEWNFTWRRRSFVWEKDILNNLLLDLQGVETTQGEDD